MCEALYTADRIKDAVECFHQMANGSGGETNLDGERLEWSLGQLSHYIPWYRHLRNIFCQTSGGSAPRNWTSSETRQGMLSGTMRPSPIIRPRCP